jgi:NAD-dependent SIR2 family protein deacetylase
MTFMVKRPVFVFGAGATAACGGPLTEELLPDAFRKMAGLTPSKNQSDDEWIDPDRMLSEKLSELAHFLRESFHVDVDDRGNIGEGAVFPSVPLLLSFLNTAIDRAQPIGSWTPERLASLKIDAQASFLFALLNANQPEMDSNPYARLLRPLYATSSSAWPVAITLNYDSLLDKTMVSLGSREDVRVPEYGCDLTIPAARNAERYGRLLKLHGSLNWLYCRRCSKLSLYMSGLDKEAFFDLLADLEVVRGLVDNTYCDRCRGALSPLIITPSALKDYRNPHVSRIWYEAEQELRNADRVVFVGYSLPWDDVEVIYLLKQSLEHLPPERITVVGHSKTPVPIHEHEAGKRYVSLFGNRIGWSPLGFKGWLDDCEHRQVSPIES